MTTRVAAFGAARWTLALALAVTSPLMFTAQAAAARAAHPADYVTINAVAGCEDPMTLTNSVVWTVRNGNDVEVEIEGLTQLSSLGTRVWEPGQTESVRTSGIDRSQLWNDTISATVGVRLQSDIGSRFVVRDVVVPNCAKDKPIVTFAEACMSIDVSMVLPSKAQWPFAVRILVGTSGGQHSVHILHPGEKKTVRVPSFAGNIVSAVGARYSPIAEYQDQSTRPCPSGGASSTGVGGGPAVGGGSSVHLTSGAPTPSGGDTSSPVADASSAASPTTLLSSGSTPDAAVATAARSTASSSWWTTMVWALAGTLVAAVGLAGAVLAVRQRRVAVRPDR